MPTPTAGESRDDFVSRCVPIVLDDGTAEDNDQAVAICMSMWSEAKTLASAPGGLLKAVKLTDTELTVENHIVLFGGRDLEQEYFDEATDLESDYTRSVGRLPIDFEHGQRVDGPDAPGPHDILGYTDMGTAEKTDQGWLVRSVLDRRNKYVQAFEPLIEAGMMGTSSQAVLEQIEKEADGRIRRWPLERNSITVNPMEPRMLGDNQLRAIKALRELSPELADVLDPMIEAAGKPQSTGTEVGDGAITLSDPFTPTGDQPMGEPTQTQAPEGPELDEESKAMKARLDEISQTLEKVLDYIEKDPAARKAGLVAPGAEDSAPQNKSFGDFLLAVRFGDMKRIKSVYKTGIDRKAFAGKDLSGTVGSTAGVLVPEEYSRELLKVDDLLSPVSGMVREVPVGTDSGTYPSLDQYISPTAGSGQTAAAAGITVGNVAAGTTLPETSAKFNQIKYLISKVGGYVDVENEVMDDSPFAIEALLRSLFQIAIAAKNERNIFRGSGVGEPLGILNAPATIAITADAAGTFDWPDALEMQTHFKSVGRPAWFIHPSMWMDLGVMESSTGGAVWQANYQGVLGQTLNGWPIYNVEHLPQADNDGCVVLADLSAYLLFRRSVLAVAYSEHVHFLEEMGVWRFSQRNDGKPWMKDKIELADPQGSFYISPFVYLKNS